jgi:guanyl-specific ribonuclease Sa
MRTPCSSRTGSDTSASGWDPALQSTAWGDTFGNYHPRGNRTCGDLPTRPKGYYKEYTVVPAGQTDRGSKRLVAGASGELFYTNSHYEPNQKGSKPFERIR